MKSCNYLFGVFVSSLFIFLIALHANAAQWQYNQHTAIGSTTTQSAPAYSTGVEALTALGNNHYNRNSDNNYYAYQFINLENINCPAGATNCSANARYKRCALGNGNTPGNDGLWRYGQYYHITVTPSSEYIFGDGYSALSTLAAQHYAGLENSSARFYFRELVNFSCNANDTSCTASPEFEWCSKSSGMTPENRDMWRHGSYEAFAPSVEKHIQQSEYLYGDPMAAISYLGHQYYDGLRHGGYSYRFISAVGLSCTNNANSVNSCTAAPRYEQCNDDTGECEFITGSGTKSPLTASNSWCQIATTTSMGASKSVCDVLVGPAMSAQIGLCQPGFKYDNTTGQCKPDDKNNGNKCGAMVSDPVNAYSGNSYQTKTDYSGLGETSLRFGRAYNSYASGQNGLGAKWLSNYHRGIRFEGIYAYVTRPDGTVYTYRKNYSLWISYDYDVKEKLVNTGGGLQYKTKNDITENYDTSGRLVLLTWPSGYSQTLTYNGQGNLTEVLDSYGDKLSFTYDNQNRVDTMSNPANQIYNYNYDNWGNLIEVIFPDATSISYLYEDPRFPNGLTGIIDQSQIRIASWTFDDVGRVIEFTRPDNIERALISYNADASTTVTNSRGAATNYKFVEKFKVGLAAEISGPGCSRCGTSGSTRYTFDSYGAVATKTVNGLQTNYINSSINNLPIYKTEAYGTVFNRRTDYTYDSRYFGKIATKSERSVCASQKKKTTYNYDNFGNTTSIAIAGYKPDCTPVSRTTSLQYNGPLNQLSQIDGPRTDVNDITTFEYYPNEPAYGYNRGRLLRVSSAGLVLRDNIQYTATGKVQSESRANGLTVTYTYYPGNDRLETVTQSDGSTPRTTRWTYLPTGEVETITVGEGSAQATTVTFGYDAARRLTRITDGAGNYIEYTLDTEGNREAETVYDSSGALHRSLAQTFDAYNRLATTAQANESGDYTFGPDGTLGEYIDGKGTSTEYSYDALKRLIESTQDVGGTDTSTANALTQYGYDVNDNLTSVTDPNAGTTQYAYDDLGNLLTQTSPDTGTSTFTYDPAGNVLTRADAKGQTFTYNYDALNRVTFVNAPYPLDDISYHYDNCPNGVGRLCSVTQGSEITNFSYNAFGEVTAHQGVGYAYDALGRVEQVTYPTGTAVTYYYDDSGLVERLDVTLDGVPRTVASDIRYAPFGPLTALTYGHGAVLSQGLDDAYRITSQSVPGIYQRDYPQYDGNGNVLGLSDLLASTNQAYDYDALNRLTDAEGGFGAQDFAYDKNGNRMQWVDNGNALTYQYETHSNRLAFAANDTIILDANGNTTSDGRHLYSYNSHNRLVGVDGNITYTYNALGQRKVKEANGNLHTYVYDTGGRLIAEYENGSVNAEYVYLNGAPIAVLKQGNVYYIHTDHLGTPRAVSDANQTVVWRWDSDPFGRTAANDDPDGDGVAFTLNLRFAGQYYDTETGLHYNYHRYYDPGTGRYLTYDPMGLHAGLNPYTYVFNNPLAYTDPLGLYTDARWISGPSFSGVSRTKIGDMGVGEYWTIIPPAIGLGGEWFMLRGHISGVVECIDEGECGEEKSDTFNVNLALGKKVGIGWGFTTAPIMQSGRQAIRAFSNISDAVSFYNNEWTQLAVSMAGNPMTWCVVAQAMGVTSGGDLNLSGDFY